MESSAKQRTKRRRSDIATDASNSPQRLRTLPISSNPFLSATPITNHDDDLLRHVMMFDSSYSEEMRNSKNDRMERFEESALYLVRMLSDSSPDHKSSLLTRTEIVQLLLPWCISHMQSPKITTLTQDHFLWKAIAVCISTLDLEDETLVTKLLSQSLLFKLVPKVARLVVASEEEAADPSEESPELSVYRSLLHRFHPTMDVACKTILLPLLSKNECTQGYYRKHDIELLRITLLWMLEIHRSRKGNPKTTFQLLSEPDILQALAQCYAVFSGVDHDSTCVSQGLDAVREILWDGLFHPRHHMEGWIAVWNKEVANATWSPELPLAAASNEGTTSQPITSTDSTDETLKLSTLHSSSFKTYHGELLETISKLFDTAAGLSFQKSIWIILPVLFLGFVQQSNLWNQSEKEKKGSSRRKDTLPMIQFHVFVCWTRPMLQSPAVSSSVPILRQMLQIVYDCDVYSPTSEHPHYKFLEYFAFQILHACTEDGAAAEVAEIEDSIQCLHLLLLLNHLLLQDDIMIDSINLCLYNDDQTVSAISSVFVVTIMNTYRKLRQQRYIFHFLLDVLRIHATKGSECKIKRLSSLLQQQIVVSALSDAMDACPIVEVKDILEFFNDWLVKSCESFNFLGFQVAVQLLSNVTRSIRVDGGTAPDIASSCQMFVSASITTLTNSKSYDEDSSKSVSILNIAMSLTGVILDLHMRCVFWLQQNDLLDIPERLSAHLLKIRNRKSRRSSGPKDELQSALFLSCHRLRQLHSLIHQPPRRSMEKDSSVSENEIAPLMKEAAQIATFISNQGELSKKYQSNDGFIALAQNFSTWVAYIPEKRHLDQFLCWVVAASAQSFQPSLMQPFADAIYSIEDVAVASSLLVDTSFFHHTEVDSEIFFVGLSLATQYITNAYTENNEFLRLIPSSIDDYTMDDCKTRLERIASCSKPHMPMGSGSDSLFRSVHSIVLLLNSFQVSRNEENNMKVLDQAIRLDQLCRSFCSRANFATVAPIVAVLRVLMMRLVAGTCASTLESLLVDESYSCDFVFGAMSSAVNLLEQNESIDSNEAKQLIDTTGQFINIVLNTMQLNCSTGSSLATKFSGLCSVSKSTQAKHALVSFSRQLLAWINDCDVTPTSFDDTSVKTNFTILFEEFKALSTEINKHFSFRQPSVFPVLPVEKQGFTDGLLLLCDLFCTNESYFGKSRQAIDDIRRSCMDCLQRSKEQRLDESCWNVVCYLTGKVALQNPCTELVMSMLDALFCDLPLEYATYILEAAVCYMVPKLPGDNLSAVLEKLTSECLSPLSASLRLRLGRHLLSYLTSENQILRLSPFGRKFFTLSLSSLRYQRDDPCWRGNIVESCALLKDLLERRDVLPLKERDLALLLSYLVVSVRSLDSTICDRGVTSDEEESAVYAAIADVFRNLFQRYTKQLSNVAPSVISLMLALLRHAMFGSTTEEDSQSMQIRVQCFTRLCEVIVGQRDVFKKYVIGLVLEFMAGLEQSRMSLWRKDALIPAVYFLLDAMSSFEMNQLNAHMNTKTRIIFRGIHQNYLKLHSYKGQ